MTATEDAYVIAGCRSWNHEIFEERISGFPGRWTMVRDRDELTVSLLERLEPRLIFFLHWSWRVPSEVWTRWECVGFHMGDLPRDRGGSPLQNLILDGRRKTRLNAFRITGETDGGPIYLDRSISLDGRAEDIYRRAGELSADMIAEIIATHPTPLPQEGRPAQFSRRRPEQSELPDNITIEQAYDFIRMLDAEGYPRAFIDTGSLRAEFRDAELEGDTLKARVYFHERKGES